MFRVLAFAIGLCIGTSAAYAQTYTVEVTPNNRSCYTIDYKPAVYLVNTRGKLMRSAGVSRSYDIVDQVGGTAVFNRVPAVYLETRRLLRSDYYTMRPAACR
jgi:hypothetical protein